MTVDERARAGLFLAMQYPVEVPGVTVTNFLRTAKTAIDGEAPSCAPGSRTSRTPWSDLRMDPTFAERNVNEGFSGGEKKRHEILQLELLKPQIAILDETDSGLDVDALRVVSEGVNRAKDDQRPRRAAHHALHAHPALHQARLRARLRRRPDRRGGRPRAGRPPRGRGLRPLPRHPGLSAAPSHAAYAMTATTFSDGELARIRADFPILARTVRDGQAAGLPRLRAPPRSKPRRSLDAERDFYEQHNARRAPRRAPARRGGHRRLRAARAPTVARFVGARPTRWCSPRTPPRRSTSSPTPSPTPSRRQAEDGRGSRSARATRSSSPRWSTTPTSCRGRSCAAAPARRCAGSPVTDDGRLDLDRPRRAAHRAHQGLRVHPRLQRARHASTRSRELAARGPRGRRARPCSTPASRCRTCRSTSPTSASTSPPSPATRCSGPTGVGVLWGRARAARTRCRRSSPAAR